MAHTQEILDALQPWKSKRFRPTEITFSEAAQSILDDDPLVVARSVTTQSRWMMMNKEDNKVAVLVHVGLWKWACDLETGNFVPDGKTAPEGIPIDRIQNIPSYKCEFSYAFDTSVDATLWDAMEVFEDHITKQPGFNKGNRPRRQWQDGKNPLGRDKYIVNAKVFAKRTPHNSKAGGEYAVAYNVHPWITETLQDNKDVKQIPNPDRPKYYDFTDGVLRKLEDTNDPQFNRNDVIWMSCKLGFVISGDCWWPEIIPIEFVRVSKLPETATNKSDGSFFPALDDDFLPLEIGAPLTLLDGHTRITKRKDASSDDENAENWPNKRHVASPENLTDKKSDEARPTLSDITNRPNLRQKGKDSRATARC